MEVDFRDSRFILPIESIETADWNEQACPNKPNGSEYMDFGADVIDVNNLLDIPYGNDVTPGNSGFNNHTFWFAFGHWTATAGTTSFCADDVERQNVHTFEFPNPEIGCLDFGQIDDDEDGIIWVDFLTQCENCHDDGSSGQGIWHKYQLNFDASEIFGGQNEWLQLNVKAVIDFMQIVPCEGFEQYGCQADELD